MIDLSTLKKLPRKKKKIVGRGPGSGHGKTSTRGHKGQKARSGGSVPPYFEGGNIPLIRKIPKRGFSNPFRKKYKIVNIENLSKIKEDEIDIEVMKKYGLVKGKDVLVKVLSEGEINRPITLKVHKISESAKKKIENAGGKVLILC
jgi:large subunit ribosomal protein L15